MAEALRGGLSLTLSGFAFSSHDIGGFEVCLLRLLRYLEVDEIVRGIRPRKSTNDGLLLDCSPLILGFMDLLLIVCLGNTARKLPRVCRDSWRLSTG